MANEKNLIPLNKRSKSEQRAIQAKGGKASGKKRKEIKTMQEIAKSVLPTVVTDEDMTLIARKFGISGEVNIKLLMILGIIKAGCDGDVKAFDKVLELIGEQNDNSMGELTNIIRGFQQEQVQDDG